MSVPSSGSWRADREECRRLKGEDFSRLLGLQGQTLPAEALALIDKHDFRYTILRGDAREKVLLDVFKRIDSDQLTTAGPDAKPRWEKGWGENLESFRKDSGDAEALLPKYIRPNQPVRLEHEYVLPEDSRFELHWFEVLREWLFRKYFASLPSVYEFGCGTGFNLATLAGMYPGKELVGLDWAQASCSLVDEIGKARGWNLKGRLFDFFAPDPGLKLNPSGGVLTVAALEQTGRNFGPFLDFLIAQRPQVCVHVEPICEWYDPNRLMDYAAIRFHRRRNYLDGFATRLAELEQQGKIQILRSRRSYFGSLYIEAYSQIIWRPV
jgi:SAM-dependent methyltransferase